MFHKPYRPLYAPLPPLMVTRAGISSSGAGCLDSLSWWETCSNLISFLAFWGNFKTHWFVHRFTVTTDYYWPSHFRGTQWLVSYPNAANSWWTMECVLVPFFSCGYVSDCGDPTSHQIRSSVFICWKTTISWNCLTYFLLQTMGFTMQCMHFLWWFPSTNWEISRWHPLCLKSCFA